MVRKIIFLLLVILPFQMVGAAFESSSRINKEAVAHHMSYHQHQHQISKSFSPSSNIADADCIFCQMGNLGSLCILSVAFPISRAEIHFTDHLVSPESSYVPYKPERPKWVVAV